MFICWYFLSVFTFVHLHSYLVCLCLPVFTHAYTWQCVSQYLHMSMHIHTYLTQLPMFTSCCIVFFKVRIVHEFYNVLFSIKFYFINNSVYYFYNVYIDSNNVVKMWLYILEIFLCLILKNCKGKYWFHCLMTVSGHCTLNPYCQKETQLIRRLEGLAWILLRKNQDCQMQMECCWRYST